MYGSVAFGGFRRCRSTVAGSAAALLAVLCLSLAPAALAAEQKPGSAAPAGKGLTVEQDGVFGVQAPSGAAAGRLQVVAWVDHADNSYAVGEKVRLFVQANKDAFVTVLNVAPSGATTLLFPQRVPARQPGEGRAGGGDSGGGLGREHPGDRSVAGSGADQGDRIDQPGAAVSVGGAGGLVALCGAGGQGPDGGAGSSGCDGRAEGAGVGRLQQGDYDHGAASRRRRCCRRRRARPGRFRPRGCALRRASRTTVWASRCRSM